LENEFFFLSGKGVQGAGNFWCRQFVVTWMVGISWDYAVDRHSISQNIKVNLYGIYRLGKIWKFKVPLFSSFSVKLIFVVIYWILATYCLC